MNKAFINYFENKTDGPIDHVWSYLMALRILARVILGHLSYHFFTIV